MLGPFTCSEFHFSYAHQLTHDLSQHAVAFGNERPAVLKEVENRLWRMVLRIGSGQKLEDELTKFMSCINMLFSKVDKEILEPHWFTEGTLLIIQF
jgi:hypothetical protein